MTAQSGKTGKLDLELLRVGNRQAIESWFLQYADALYTFVFYRVGKDQDLATEVAQDTFVVALNKIPSYDPERGTMFTWLTWISKNGIRKALKQKGRNQQHSQHWGPLEQQLLAAYEQLATSPLPEELLDLQETAELVHMTMTSIPGNYRKVLEQRYYQDRALKQIARSEGISEQAVKSLLHRARLAFKQAFLTFGQSISEQVPRLGRGRIGQ